MTYLQRNPNGYQRSRLQRNYLTFEPNGDSDFLRDRNRTYPPVSTELLLHCAFESLKKFQREAWGFLGLATNVYAMVGRTSHSTWVSNASAIRVQIDYDHLSGAVEAGTGRLRERFQATNPRGDWGAVLANWDMARDKMFDFIDKGRTIYLQVIGNTMNTGGTGSAVPLLAAMFQPGAVFSETFYNPFTWCVRERSGTNIVPSSLNGDSDRSKAALGPCAVLLHEATHILGAIYAGHTTTSGASAEGDAVLDCDMAFQDHPDVGQRVWYPGTGAAAADPGGYYVLDAAGELRTYTGPPGGGRPWIQWPPESEIHTGVHV